MIDRNQKFVKWKLTFLLALIASSLFFLTSIADAQGGCCAWHDGVKGYTCWHGGENINGLDDEALTKIRRDKIGFVFPQFDLIATLTALENIEYPMILKGVNGHEEKSKELVSSVGLDEEQGNEK